MARPAASSRSTTTRIRYLTRHRPPAERVALVAAYAKAQGMYRTKTTPDPVFTDVLKLELGAVEPSLAGPEAPAGPRPAKEVKSGFAQAMDQGIRQGRREATSACRSRAAITTSATATW